MPQVSREIATQTAIEHVKRQKGTDKIDIALVEGNSGGWVVRGTCPIDLEGHQWAEKFEVSVDPKGKIRSAYFALL